MKMNKKNVNKITLVLLIIASLTMIITLGGKYTLVDFQAGVNPQTGTFTFKNQTWEYTFTNAPAVGDCAGVSMYLDTSSSGISAETRVFPTSCGGNALRAITIKNKELDLCAYDKVEVYSSGYATVSGTDTGNPDRADYYINGVSVAYSANNAGSGASDIVKYTKQADGRVFALDLQGHSGWLDCSTPQNLQISIDARQYSNRISSASGFTLSDIKLYVKEQPAPVIQNITIPQIDLQTINNTIVTQTITITNNTQTIVYACSNGEIVDAPSDCVVTAKSIDYTFLMILVGIIIVLSAIFIITRK